MATHQRSHESVGRVKRSVPVSNRVLALTGTSLRFFTRPTLIYLVRRYASLPVLR